MAFKRLDIVGDQVILHTNGLVCSTAKELIGARVFENIVSRYCHRLVERESPLAKVLPGEGRDEAAIISLLRGVAEAPLAEAVAGLPDADRLLAPSGRAKLHEVIEGLYDYWRSFDRFMVLHSESGPEGRDRRPYRAFNETIEALQNLVRAVYRDACENVTGDHPSVYRQVAAGCNVGLIAAPKETKLPAAYSSLVGSVPFIRQVWIAPPMLIDPPTNKRTGKFERVDESPLTGLALDSNEWLCYPAQVGPLVIFIYFHQHFMGLGCSLANLFELATDEQIAAGPQAVYFYGAPPAHMARFGASPTVFFDDRKNDLLVAAVPAEDRFGYFGYLKKMVLTLHNVVMMKRGRMPYHGAMVTVTLRGGESANVLIIGDTGTGKSESLEALRLLGKDRISDLRIVADDMGSLEIGQDGRLVSYGTEIGAFVRLDDLQQGYAFEQLDRAIIMSPQKINARAVLPVTSLRDVLRGNGVDYILYANNYEQVDDDHPLLERFDSAEEAMDVFSEGAAMSKGTTTSTGLVHSYYANIFGPPEYRKEHDALAERTFKSAFEHGVFVGQIRTRLGIPGCEQSGPEGVAKALLEEIAGRKSRG